MTPTLAARLVELATARGLRAYAYESNPRPDPVGESRTWVVNLNLWPEDSFRIELDNKSLVCKMHWLDLPEVEL